MKQVGEIIIIGLFLPFVLMHNIYKSQRSIGKKIGYFLLIIVVFGFTWLNGYNEIKDLITYTLFQAGITDRITKVKVSGTSMLPTIKDGSEVTLNSPKKYGLKRGDIVSFNNQETGNLFYIKRIVAMPGEQISIRNGHYYINGKALEEDYTLNQLPTYGNTFLPDCENITVPQNHYFVSGDNRTVSFDSRAIGFINKDDIEGVIKTNTTEKFVTPQVQANLLKADVNPETFLKKLNEKRVKHEVSQIVTHATLNGLATKRAEQIRDNFNDWKSKTIPVDKLLDASGYRYNLLHEFVTFGYLDEQATVDQIFDSPVEKDAFLSSKYTEVGIGIIERTVQECKYPIISIILSWPAVPTYDQEAIDSWAREVSYTSSSLTNLQTYVGLTRYDQEKIKRMIQLIAEQSVIATRIYNKMKNREWLSQKDNQDIQLYDSLAKESNQLASELSIGKVKGISTRKEANRRL